MKQPLLILLIEDSESDAELIRAALRRQGRRTRVSTVATEPDFIAALDDGPDVILSDFRLPGFSGLRALELLRARDQETPFILVSGTVGEEIAVEAMRLGATDYLLKDRLARLMPAIERALSLRAAQAEKASATQALLQSQADLEIAQQRAGIGSWELDLKTGRGRWSRQMYRMFRRDPSLRPPRIDELLDYIHPEDRQQVFAEYAPREYSRTQRRIDFRTHPERGPVSHLSATIDVLRDAQDRPILGGGTVLDITERKHAEARMLRLNRTLEVMRQINGLIIRVRSREDLYRGACDIAVAEGRFAFAWIGLCDAAAGVVRPAASAGPHAHFLDALTLAAPYSSDTPGLIGRALRERNPIVVNDIGSDPRASARAAALQEGFSSVIVLPLRDDREAPSGVLLLYAKQEDAFDGEEIRLLQELAGDVSFALDHLEKTERLDHLAYYDALTGLPNRSLLKEQLAQIINSSRREERAAAVVMLDFERFRLINGSLGRDGGDEFLRQAAARLRGAARAEDSVARIGADLFVIAMPALDKAAEAAHLLNSRILQAFEQPFAIQGRELRISARAGIAMFPSDGADADTLLGNAETALRTAKGNLTRFAFHEPELNARISETLLLETRLKSALKNNEFVLHYQPKVDLRSGAVVGLEALIRWRDPKSGLVPPAEFIPLLEETGMIVEVGRWALEQAVSDSLEWAARGRALPRVAVNVSPIQVRQAGFVDTVKEAIRRFPPHAVALDLEITESAIMEQLDEMIARLSVMRGIGVGVSLDDFGTGHSSLGCLSKLPLDSLKIDRSFINDMESGEYAHDIVAMICALAKAGDLTLIAEGVETENQAAMLRSLGCDQMQGYLFSKALPLEALDTFLRSPAALPVRR